MKAVFSSSKILSFLIPPNQLYNEDAFRKAKRGGINYHLKINDYQDWLVYFNLDLDSSSQVLNYIPKDAELILDVGGNIGQTAMLMATNFSNAKVISFEPFPNTLNRFKNNLSLNSNITNVSIHGVGLGAENKLLKMVVECPTNSGGNRLTGSAETDEYVTEVDVVTLDGFVNDLKSTKIDFVKIDVEGFEYEVLKGASDVLKKFMPRLFIEIDHCHLERSNAKAADIFQFLKSHSYKVFNSDTLEELDNVAKFNHLKHFDIICYCVKKEKNIFE